MLRVGAQVRSGFFEECFGDAEAGLAVEIRFWDPSRGVEDSRQPQQALRGDGGGGTVDGLVRVQGIRRAVAPVGQQRQPRGDGE